MKPSETVMRVFRINLSAVSLLFLWAPLSPVSFGAPENNPEGGLKWVARDDYNTGDGWETPKRCGKNFWLLLEKDFPREQIWDRPNIKDEEFIKESGWARLSPGQPKDFNSRRIIVREIEVFDESGRNRAPEAAVSSPGNNLSGLRNIVDGDRNSFCHSETVSMEPLESVITLDFPGGVKVSGIKILGGYNRCENDPAPLYCPEILKIQGADGGEWHDIPVPPPGNANPPELTVRAPRPLSVRSLKFFIAAGGNKIPAAGERMKIESPYYFAGGRYAYGEFSGMRKTPDDFSKYDALKAESKNFCLGFWLPEWGNDINWGRGEIKMSLLRGFVRQHGLQDKYPPESLPPKTREEAAGLLEIIYKKQKEALRGDVFGLNSNFFWDHYNLEWGGNLAAIEVTSCAARTSLYNIQTAFCRGAARQYHKEWMNYQAYFYNAATPDYLSRGDTESVNPSGPGFGIPVSLGRRDLYHAFYSGASFFDFENPKGGFLMKNKDGSYELSPHGKAVREFYGFCKKHPDRGAPYTPVAFVLDYLHGWTGSFHSKDKVWFTIPYNDGDYMIRGVMSAVWKFGKYDFRTRADQNKDSCIGLVNTPYGDIFDVLVANPPSGVIDGKTLNNYKALILLGDIKADAVLAERLMSYVGGGGTLVINSAQAGGSFPSGFLGVEKESVIEAPEGPLWKVRLKGAEPVVTDRLTQEPLITRNKHGAGFVILTLPLWLINRDKKPSDIIKPLLSGICGEVSPFKVEGDIGFQINRGAGAWTLVLMNNKGVIKDRFRPEEFDTSQTAKVRVTPKIPAAQIEELTQDGVITPGKTCLELSVPPGGMKILEFKDLSADRERK